MALYDEKQKEKETKKNKNLKIFLIIITILIVLIIAGLVAAIIYFVNNPSQVTVKLDGTENSSLSKIIEVETTEDGSVKVTAPIKKIAEYFGYKAYNGEYTTVSEDTNSGYVISENEVAMFEVDSNIITKLDLTNSDAEYEYCKIDEAVFMEDETLYTDDEGLEEIFNLYMTYNADKKILSIYTLENLIESAGTVATDCGYENIDENFVNYKAILDNMIVVISENDQYGVIDYSTGDNILGDQYDLITYVPQEEVFIVEKDSKVGIIGSDGVTRIKTIYDSLTLIDNENELYLAESGGLYGVIDINGTTIIPLDYEQIGIDISEFGQNGLSTGYVLLDLLIPVKQNNLWGFFDVEGSQVTTLQYEEIGCTTSSENSLAYNLVVIEEKELVVVQRDDCYTFINLTGEEVFSCVFEDIYMEISSGSTEYYMVWNEKTYNVIDEYEKQE